MGQTINSVHQTTRAFAIMKKKRPSSEPKVGVAPINGKTPSFRQPGYQHTLARGFTSLGHPRFALS